VSKSKKKICQKVVKQLSKSCQKVVKNCQQVVKKLQKVDKSQCPASLVILCVTGSHLKENLVQLLAF
jgi:transcriptional regulatory protein LevR